MKEQAIVAIERIVTDIHLFRGQKVMLDQDLASAPPSGPEPLPGRGEEPTLSSGGPSGSKDGSRDGSKDGSEDRPMPRTYLKIGMKHGACGALAEQGVQAGGIAALWPRLQNAALPDAPPHSIGTERLSRLVALSAQGNTFLVFLLCARLASRENRLCHAHANFEIGSDHSAIAPCRNPALPYQTVFFRQDVLKIDIRLQGLDSRLRGNDHIRPQ